MPAASKKKIPSNGTALGKTLKKMGIVRNKTYVYNELKDFDGLNMTSIVYTDPSSINPKILRKIGSDNSPRSKVLKMVIENRTNLGPLHSRDPERRADNLLDWQKYLIGRTNQSIVESRRNRIIDQRFEEHKKHGNKKRGGRRRTYKKKK